MAIAGFLESYVFGPSGFWTMAPLPDAAKFDPFLSVDCARVEGGGVQILPPGNTEVERFRLKAESTFNLLSVNFLCVPSSSLFLSLSFTW